MKLWLDAQLPPSLAAWINQQSLGLEAFAVRTLGLRDALDSEIFQAARQASVLVMTKDRDFVNLLEQHGPPPQVIWLRIGNSSNQALQETLSNTLAPALDLLRGGEPWVEVRATGRR
ncbi:MAG: hypothetical protein EBZ24_11525 [Synechococcaceae bacterium WB9_4xB_025]|jgi:predicted nuclease of predicted toxin-antitoxin system|nr:hypothetical protein [Synechococcaceae bacterium WB9_4xB_025]